MRLLHVGLVLAVFWASTMAKPVERFSENDLKEAFLQGILFGRTAIESEDLETENIEDGHLEKTDVKNTGNINGAMKETANSQSDDAETYKPIYKFDGKASEDCYPDWAKEEWNDYCEKTLYQHVPIYYQTNTCSGTTVYTYWLWYGWQNNCDCCSGSHDNDWEHVSVYVENNQVQKVVFFQHKGWYTRSRGNFEQSGERPVVYVGKVGHGSYHNSCNGKQWYASWKVSYCAGGCGYWDDFRNPGETLSSGTLTDLQKGQTIDGIARPDREICESDLGTCHGAHNRVLHTSGCWQDNP